MTLWNSLAKRINPRGYQARVDLAEAYRDVFLPQHRATDPQKEMVLADLQNFSGWQRVSGSTFTGGERAFADGMRATYGRVFRFLRLAPHEVRELEEAARQEAIMDSAQGEI